MELSYQGSHKSRECVHGEVRSQMTEYQTSSLHHCLARFHDDISALFDDLQHVDTELLVLMIYIELQVIVFVTYI